MITNVMRESQRSSVAATFLRPSPPLDADRPSGLTEAGYGSLGTTRWSVWRVLVERSGILWGRRGGVPFVEQGGATPPRP